ncbi:troponin T, skeletal muscle-like [Macrobrachium nipponense]|uniref:troponin T, skeletal muscle-like n=1 Tax=Macrobrachium nipponense TaxID=159736 RepID=UPI0030C8D149
MFSVMNNIVFTVKSTLAVILLGLVILSLVGSPLLFGSANVGYILGKNLVVCLLGGLLAYAVGEYYTELSFFAQEKELLLKELEEAYLMNLSLLDEIETSSDNEELLAERNEDLDKDLAEEQFRVEELLKIIDEDETRLSKVENENEELVYENLFLRKKNEKFQDVIVQRNKEVDKLEEQLKLKGTERARNAEVIRELKNEIVDNEVYCGVLEEKVKIQEEEEEKTKQLVSNLKENLQEFQDEVSFLRARNCDLQSRLENEARENLGLERKVQILEDGNQHLQKDLALKESQIVSSMEALHDERKKNEILAEELLVLKKWIAELARKKEKINDSLVEKECELRSVVEDMEKEREKNRLLVEELLVLRNWIAELAEENEEIEGSSQEESEEDDDSDKVNEVESEVTQDNGGHSQEAKEVGELELNNVNQEGIEVTEDNEEESEEMEECHQTNNEENNKVDTKKTRNKKRRNKKRRKPAGEEDSSRLCVVQSMVLETHNENLHSIMLPAEFQELLQKNENGLDFIKYKNKVVLNFMHHDKAHIRAVLSRCCKSAAEEVLVDLQKLLLRILA